VLFECAAASLPFMSTDVGNSVEINSWTQGGEIMKTEIDERGLSHVNVAAAVNQLQRLYVDKSLRQSMAERAHTAWQKKFSWEKITIEYEQLYKKLVNDHH
jgi:glycosyltransferase involved in cell wall biosynthesis